MSDASNVARNLRERLGANTEERLGKALSDLLENPLLTGAIGRAFVRRTHPRIQSAAIPALLDVRASAGDVATALVATASGRC